MRKFLVAALFFLVLLSGNTMAVDVSDLTLQGLDEYSPGQYGRYIGDSHFTAYFDCVGSDYTGAEIVISKPGSSPFEPQNFQETNMGGNVTQISYSINPSGLYGTGFYTFEATCLGNTSGTDSKNFDIYDFELEIISPTGTLEKVQGDYITTDFSFKRIIDSMQEEVDDARFNVILSKDGQEFILENNKIPDKYGGNLRINSLIYFIPNENFYGLNDLVVEYTSENIYGTVPDAIDLKKAFEIYFEDSSPIQMSSGGSLDVPIFVNSPIIEPIDLYELVFDVEIDGSHESISGSEITCSQGGTGLYRCVLPISVPDESPGSYQLEIEGQFQSYYDTISKEIYFTVPFMGSLTYASGQIVDAEIELLNLDTGKWYKTSVNGGTGKYSLELLPGEYKLKLTSPEIKMIEIDGINIKEGSEMITANSPMSVDSFGGGNSIAGINSVKLAVFQFALEFDSAEIWFHYNDIDVTGSEDDLELYSCHDWNYGKRQCNGEWNSMGFNINMVTNIIHFNVTEFSAFILGNKKSMSMEVTMDKDTYNSREHITFTGNIEDSGHLPIENAKISYEIEGTGLSGSTYTDERGYFIAADLVAPEEEGTYTMEITVEKNPYKAFTTTYPVKIKKKTEFTLVVPDEVKVRLDESVQAKISIINTGQIDLNSISLSARGISTDWYTMVPMTIANLTVNSEKTVTMNFRVPSEYCEEKCQIYYFVDIIAKSDTGLEQIKSFTFQIDQNVTEEIAPGFSLPSLPTGNILESVSNPYTIVILFIVVAFVFLFFIKKSGTGLKRSKPSFSRRSFHGGTLNVPTFFKKQYSQGYRSPLKTTPFKSSNFKRKAPRESVVPTLYQVKKSTREWNK